jgi:hypothetical protein
VPWQLVAEQTGAVVKACPWIAAASSTLGAFARTD